VTEVRDQDGIAADAVEAAAEDLDSPILDLAQERDLLQSVVAHERDVLQSVLAAFGQGLIVADAAGTVVTANREAESYFRVRKGLLVGQPLRDYCMLEQPDEIDELYRRYADDGDRRSYADDVEHAGRWYRLRFSRLQRVSGEFLGVLLTIQDVHEDVMRAQQTRASAFELEMTNRELADTKDRIEAQAGQLVIALEEVKAADARAQEQNAKLLKDLESARRIQHSLLPRNIPEVAEVRFSFRYEPCEGVGGDFFDVFLLDPHHLAIYLADVSGHGVSAAMLAVFAKQAIKTIETTFRRGIVPPDEVLTRLNQELIRAQFEDMPFITIFYGVLDTRTMNLTFSAAAHPVPILLDAGSGGVRTLAYPETSPLGWFTEEKYALVEAEIRPGERLLLHTDGVTEIFSEAGELIEHDGFHGRLQELADREPDAFAAAILEMVRAYTGKTVQDDDITLLVLDHAGRADIRPDRGEDLADGAAMEAGA
jgi:PAS domain S-box-containing protein